MAGTGEHAGAWTVFAVGVAAEDDYDVGGLDMVRFGSDRDVRGIQSEPDGGNEEDQDQPTQAAGDSAGVQISRFNAQSSIFTIFKVRSYRCLVLRLLNHKETIFTKEK
jgi:hypothetical protein